MAINILQQPTSPNMANADLLFEVSSSQYTQPQFQFVCDVFQSGSATLIQRIKQQPNPSGYGVFNMRQILSYQLDSDKNWKTAKFATASQAEKRFVIKFGEEYGSSVSSSVSLYNGINQTASQAPAKSGSAYYTIINGLVEPNAGYWNFPSQSYFTPTITPTAGADTIQAENTLTYAPTTKVVQVGEYETISLINGNFDNGATAQDIFGLQVDQYDSSNTLISSSFTPNITSNGGGARTSISQLWTAISASQTAGTQLLTIGVGPQNLSDAGTPISSSCAYYEVKVVLQDSANTKDTTNYYAYRRYNIGGAECISNGARFAWKNEFGMWDYYTFTLAEAQTSNMERLDYQQVFVPYNTSTTAVNYDITRRGANPFNTKITQDKTANSNWLTQTEADWLRELFYSTDVYIQDGSNFLPIVITNASVVEKTNPRTQKLFNYQVTYRLANQPRSRF